MYHMKDVILEPSQKTVNGGHIYKMDGWIPMCTTEGRCSLSDCSLTNTDLVLIPDKPKHNPIFQIITINIYYLLVHLQFLGFELKPYMLDPRNLCTEH